MKDFFKKYKIYLIIAAVAAAALTFAFFMGGKGSGDNSAPDVKIESASVFTQPLNTDAQNTTSAATQLASSLAFESTEADTKADSDTQPSFTQPATSSKEIKPAANTTEPRENATEKQTEAGNEKKDKYKTEPVPKDKPAPVEPQEQTTASQKTTITLSISCKTILSNMDKLRRGKADLVPSDGWILAPEEVEINEGESAFDVLLRICQDKKIHMEYSWTPVYNSVYLEGIGNIYELDCGSTSGWEYKVNDWFPNYGCSRYVLNSSDVLCFEYTCNLGEDIGNRYFGEE